MPQTNELGRLSIAADVFSIRVRTLAFRIRAAADAGSEITNDDVREAKEAVEGAFKGLLRLYAPYL